MAAPVTNTVVRRQLNNHRLPPWLRIWCWALDHANGHGHARAYPGQLRTDLGLSKRDVSRALDQARGRGLIDPTSTAWCVVLPGAALAPCEGNHREAT